MSLDISLKDSLDYYDKNMDLYMKYIDEGFFYKIEIPEDDLSKGHFILKNKDGKIILEKNMECLGIYFYIKKNVEIKYFSWSWIFTLNKPLIRLMKKMLTYGIDIYSKNLFFKKFHFCTSHFDLKHLIFSDLHVAIASYFTKIPFIFPVITDKSMFFFENKKFLRLNKTIKKKNKFNIIYLMLYD